MNVSLTLRFSKNWELENGNNRGFGVQKVAKTGNIGKKSPVAGDMDYVRYLSMQKVKEPVVTKAYFYNKMMTNNMSVWCLDKLVFYKI